MAKKFYITTPIFYPNAKLHMGHAYVVTISDILARYHRLIQDETYFLTGSDENTGKILEKINENQSVEEYLAELSENFKDLYKKLDISFDQFIRTSDRKKHWPGAQLMWRKLMEAGDIYKSKYSGLYCMECEAFYTEKDLIDGKCRIHGIELQKIEEENYFFKLSKYTEEIKKKIESDELKILPTTRKNEILALLNRGLEDVSFSRPIKNVPHGIPVPGDESQVIYVWCDALVNYISALGYGVPPLNVRGGKGELFKFWPADVHVIGKDILRFHAAIWPAMLLSASLPLPKKLLVHGFITSRGKKMSKSLGNVIDPQDLITEYGSEAVRYYLARHISPFEDGDLTVEGFKEAYNAHLANGLGNLVSRVMKLAEDNLDDPTDWDKTTGYKFKDYLAEKFNEFRIDLVMEYIWAKIGELDREIQEKKPWESKDKETIKNLVLNLYRIGFMLKPFMPKTAEVIIEATKHNGKPENLFARKE